MKYYSIAVFTPTDIRYHTVKSTLTHKKFVYKLMRVKVYQLNNNIYINNGICHVSDISKGSSSIHSSTPEIKFGADIE